MAEKKIRINNLNTIAGLTGQMRTVYRLARKNIKCDDVDPQTAKVLIDILKIITSNQRDNELEQRITALEKKK